MNDHVVRRLLAVLTVVAIAFALKATAPVSLPLAFALFLMALAWPLYRWIEERTAAGWAVLGSLLALLLAAGLFVGAIWLAAAPVLERAPRYADSPGAVIEDAREWARDHGLPVGAPQSGDAAESNGSAPAGTSMRSLADRMTSLGGGIVLVLAFFVLGLAEAHDFRRKLETATGSRADRRWKEPLTTVITGFQRYIVVRTGTGLVTGVACGLYAWAIGLELAVVWGALNFLLNYIPTLGSIVAVLPPTVFALGEHGSQMALLTAAGIGGIQLLVGNYIDPRIQGKYLQLSPLVVLLSVAFWGWMWGIAGAFIGIPLTVALVTGLDQFEETRWAATLLSRNEERDDGNLP